MQAFSCGSLLFRRKAAAGHQQADLHVAPGVRLALGHNPAAVDDRQAVGQAAYLVQIGGDEQDGLAAVPQIQQAVVDDIGGIIIIALFYSGEIAFEPLLISLALLALLYVGGRMRVNNIAFYYIIGFFVWMLFLESGIHPTIAGVLVAFTVPARPVVKLDDFTCEMTGYLDMLDYTEVRHSRKAAVLSSTQIQVLNNIHSLADKTISPLQSIANKLHPLVNYLILPLFAFVNAGVTFGDIGIGSLLGIPLAVFFGLFAGKSLGIFLFTYIFVRLRLATMPEGVSKRNLFGVSMLGGIGFTVALFIANLSFAGMPDVGVELLNQAKLGVFAGSFISGLCGYLILKKVLPKNYRDGQT